MRHHCQNYRHPFVRPGSLKQHLLGSGRGAGCVKKNLPANLDLVLMKYSLEERKLIRQALDECTGAATAIEQATPASGATSALQAAISSRATAALEDPPSAQAVSAPAEDLSAVTSASGIDDIQRAAYTAFTTNVFAIISEKFRDCLQQCEGQAIPPWLLEGLADMSFALAFWGSLSADRSHPDVTQINGMVVAFGTSVRNADPFSWNDSERTTTYVSGLISTYGDMTDSLFPAEISAAWHKRSIERILVAIIPYINKRLTGGGGERDALLEAMSRTVSSSDVTLLLDFTDYRNDLRKREEHRTIEQSTAFLVATSKKAAVFSKPAVTDPQNSVDDVAGLTKAEAVAVGVEHWVQAVNEERGPPPSYH